ncbi:MAG: hypothetical protein NTW21_40425 [Verrucomicrobia bacterium]|nr:hypothetical protein [Verrucomicrobiota bacterium]
MNLYRQSIALFGIVLPLLACGLLIALCFTLKSKALASFHNKQTLFKAYETSRIQALKIENQIVLQRPHIKHWMALLAEESSSAVNTHLRAIAEILPGKEFQKTAFERTTNKGGFGTAIAQNSSQLRIVFRGTFRSMQRAFLELESRMPQLQLQELRIEPSQNQQNQAPVLNFQVTYTAWEN